MMASKPRNKAAMDAEAVARLMAAQEQDGGDASEETLQAEPPPVATPTSTASAFDPGKMDGRTLRRTGREPFATRIRPETHEALRRIAYNRRITIAEALEMAVTAFDRG